MRQFALWFLIGMVVACVNPNVSGGAVSPHMADIRFCESSNNYQATNATTTASGAYQFLDTTWAEHHTGYARAKDAPGPVQDRVAREHHAKYGDAPWAESRPCWSKRNHSREAHKTR